ncbi:hypothetical protein [Clostridium intestinale]|uniref:hypothetical protein n=1 Tax=Clostridium intestinale TaxID=36845 RepID=UPI002DD65000|nr:hypothetical protein [Clostridium intestinale]WRY49497.1 hypothetical protein P8F83_12250 [Clostridium intestinale]
MSKAEFMQYANYRIKKKQLLKEKGERDARDHSIENALRINKRLQPERTRRNHKW